MHIECNAEDSCNNAGISLAYFHSDIEQKMRIILQQIWPREVN